MLPRWSSFAPAAMADGLSTPIPAGIDLRSVTDEVIRDLIRRDPALWERVRNDPDLRREFGFDDV